MAKKSTKRHAFGVFVGLYLAGGVHKIEKYDKNGPGDGYRPRLDDLFLEEDKNRGKEHEKYSAFLHDGEART